MKIDTRSIITNGIIAALYVVLTYVTYPISFLVAIGQTTVMIVGYILFIILKRRKDFYEIIQAKQNIAFIW